MLAVFDDIIFNLLNNLLKYSWINKSTHVNYDPLDHMVTMEIEWTLFN